VRELHPCSRSRLPVERAELPREWIASPGHLQVVSHRGLSGRRATGPVNPGHRPCGPQPWARLSRPVGPDASAYRCGQPEDRPDRSRTLRCWIAMRRILRFFLWGLFVVVALGALLVYFVYSPTPEVPRLSGELIKGTIEAGGLKRTYLTYVPQGLTEGAPLVVVMHGSGQNRRSRRTCRLRRTSNASPRDKARLPSSS
jgi:hypothetical protein